MNDATLIRRAPGAHACCDPAGRICAIAHQALPLLQVVRIAVTRGEGSEPVIRERITDMLASGLLIELEG